MLINNIPENSPLSSSSPSMVGGVGIAIGIGMLRANTVKKEKKERSFQIEFNLDKLLKANFELWYGHCMMREHGYINIIHS